MVTQPTVLCPIDFSEGARGALRYAAALAEHFFATLVVVAVDHPLLRDAADAALGEGLLESRTRGEMQQYVAETFRGRVLAVRQLQLRQAVGDPATEIHRAARSVGADVVVMSTHGASGVRKLVFGSTTERVLRHAEFPVVVAPAEDRGPDSLEAWQRTIHSIVVPVDLSGYSRTQIRIACAMAEALRTSIVVAHVLAPGPHGTCLERLAQRAAAERHADAYDRLEQLLASVPPGLPARVALATGDPAAEIARIAREQRAGAIVMALHGTPGICGRMGTVTYRVLCQAPALVVAWPPAPEGRHPRLVVPRALATI